MGFTGQRSIIQWRLRRDPRFSKRASQIGRGGIGFKDHSPSAARKLLAPRFARYSNATASPAAAPRFGVGGPPNVQFKLHVAVPAGMLALGLQALGSGRACIEKIEHFGFVLPIIQL